jgi:hypothetical protein
VPPAVTVQTPVVDDVNVTLFPDPPPVAVTVKAVPKFFVPGFANVIVWAARMVTEFDAAEGKL